MMAPHEDPRALEALELEPVAEASPEAVEALLAALLDVHPEVDDQ